MTAAKSPKFRRRALNLVSQVIPVAQVARDLGACSGFVCLLACEDLSSLEGCLSCRKRFLWNWALTWLRLPGGPMGTSPVISRSSSHAFSAS
jgi:hypothetical protein